MTINEIVQTSMRQHLEKKKKLERGEWNMIKSEGK